jgi:hypothetical protein
MNLFDCGIRDDPEVKLKSWKALDRIGKPFRRIRQSSGTRNQAVQKDRRSFDTKENKQLHDCDGPCHRHNALRPGVMTLLAAKLVVSYGTLGYCTRTI